MNEKMNQSLLKLCAICLAVGMLAFIKEDKKSIGAIGDVKYSVLPPDKFIERNGDGWELMDDEIPLSTSALYADGVTELPDARGMFLRGINLKRNDDFADPYSQEASKERLVGSSQASSFRQHSHEIRYSRIPHSTCNGEFPALLAKACSSQPGQISVKTTEDTGNKSETRPNNIALFIYVKIN